MYIIHIDECQTFIFQFSQRFQWKSLIPLIKYWSVSIYMFDADVGDVASVLCSSMYYVCMYTFVLFKLFTNIFTSIFFLSFLFFYFYCVSTYLFMSYAPYRFLFISRKCALYAGSSHSPHKGRQKKYAR